MRRFLMLVGVAAVAGAMYVAAASGSQQSTGPTAKQFKALKTQVAALSKKLKTTQNNLDALAAAYVHCSLPKEIGIAQKGGSTFGYNFTPGAGSPFSPRHSISPPRTLRSSSSPRSTPVILGASPWSAPPPFGTTLPV
jgi:hypothetical protein